MTILTIGGILLIFGACCVYQGKVFYSTAAYTLADGAWIINAYHQGDVFGVISINIGILTGLAVMWKMQKGVFHKDLRVKKENKEEL